MAPLHYAAKFNPFFPWLAPSTLAQSKERKGSNFAIWQPCCKEEEREDGVDENDEEDGNSIAAIPKPPPSVASSGGGARKIEKNFFLSVESIQYNREIGAAVLPCSSTQQSGRGQQQVNINYLLQLKQKGAVRNYKT